MIETVIFDMDGLLVDTEPLWRDALNQVFEDLEIVLTPEEMRKTMGIRTSEVVEYWHREKGWKEKTTEEVEHLIYSKVIDLVKEKGREMPGVEQIMHLFQTKNLKVGLASSSPMVFIQAVLKHFQLTAYFETIHSAEHEDYGKPHPSVYLAAAKELNTHADRCLVFEDSVNGMIAGKAAKMKVVVVPEPSDFDNPRFSLADLKLGSLEDFTEGHLLQLQV